MANGGWYGTKQEWDHIEAPLLGVDSIIEGFAKEVNLSVTRNHKSWPERSIVWGTDVRCLMQLYLEGGKEDSFTLWICASQDRYSKRYLKKESLIKAQSVASFRDNLAGELRVGHQKLVDWSGNIKCLEFVTTVG